LNHTLAAHRGLRVVADASDEGIEVSVLGSLHVSVAGSSIVPSARKTRSLLALLAINPDRVVTTARISEELWGEDPPRSASTTLQTYVMQLRNAIAASPAGRADDTATKRLLRRCGTGYQLNVGRGHCDVVDFGRLVSAGTRKAQDGELYAAADLLQRGLDLWRGSALVDVALGPVLDAEVVRLEQLRRSALERRIQIDLAIGRHHSAADELSGLALADLTNESVHGHLMLALHRCGRRAHALHAFHRLRTAMLAELGLEPSPWLHRLQQAILDADPTLDVGDHYKIAIGLG
jgi:SARP family transcriptional regulator, regulator of embCAB operon